MKRIYLAIITLLLTAATAFAAPVSVRKSQRLEDFDQAALWVSPRAEVPLSSSSSSLRAELECAEITDQYNDIHRQSMRAHADAGGLTPGEMESSGTRAVFLNIQRDFSSGPVKPYMKGGVGLAYDQGVDREEAAIAGLSGAPVSSGAQAHDTRLAWNAGVGVDVEASDSVKVDIGYRVAGTDGSDKDFHEKALGTGLAPMLSQDLSGAPTHLFSVGISIGF